MIYVIQKEFQHEGETELRYLSELSYGVSGKVESKWHRWNALNENLPRDVMKFPNGVTAAAMAADDAVQGTVMDLYDYWPPGSLWFGTWDEYPTVFQVSSDGAHVFAPGNEIERPIDSPYIALHHMIWDGVSDLDFYTKEES